MKIYLLIIATIFLYTPGVYSQNVLDGIYAKSEEEQISDIDKMKQEIKTNLASFKENKIFKNATDFRAVYKKRKELQFIMDYSKDQNQNIDYVKEWYFYNGKLIYVEQIVTERTLNKIIDLEKYYLDNEHLIVWIQSDSKVDHATVRFKKADEALTDYIVKLKAETRKK